MIKKFNQFIKEGYSGDGSIIFHASNSDDFIITYTQLDEIMYYISDEFPNIDYMLDNTLQSSIIEPDNHTFLITLYDKSIDFPNDLPQLYYLEPNIHDCISSIDDQLRQYGLYVFGSDYGETDAYYELVITKIGNIPVYNNKRYDKDGNDVGWDYNYQ